MIQLDYQTNNRRWGITGLKFSSWESYSFILGYLSNKDHYVNIQNNLNEGISIHIEGNNNQGAWGEEGRIHFYGSINYLKTHLRDLFINSSAGNGRITRRINSNGFIMSLVENYNFDVLEYQGRITLDVFPPENIDVSDMLAIHLHNSGLTQIKVNTCLNSFQEGFEL